MENKTAMQQLIETLKGYYGNDNLLAINFDSFLEREKKAIIEAVAYGNDYLYEKGLGEEYYNKNFK